MNVLILSASAKTQLVAAFREAAAERGGRVVACDVAADSAALFEADAAFLIPRSDDPRFGPALLDLCAVQHIKLVVPTRDGELNAVGALAPPLRSRGTEVLVPTPSALDICGDKARFTAFCHGLGLPVARVFAPGEIPDAFPVFARPRVGAGGVGAGLIASRAAFVERSAELGSMIVQEFVGDPEYTIDVLMDLRGRPLQAVARSRLSIKGGESQKSRVEDIPVLTEGALRLCAELALVGHNVVQAFFSPENGARYIELNPRFGGASTLSIAAGLDSPRRILAMVAGDDTAATAPRPIRYGLTLLRHTADRLVDPEMLAAVPRAP